MRLSKAGVLFVGLVFVFNVYACKEKSDTGISVTKAPLASEAEQVTTAYPDQDVNQLALFNCTIIDGTAAVIEDGVILISGDRIGAVGSSEEVTIPEDYTKLDLNKRTVLPGFINTHVHDGYIEENLRNWLKGGVTTVRDLGATPSTDITSIRDENNLKSDTARLLASSPILTVPDGYGRDYFTSPEEAAELVNSYVNKKVDAIKFSIEDFQQGRQWEMPTEEELKAIVDTAHAGGKQTVAHITHTRFLDEAVELGLDQIGHMVVENVSEETCKMLVDQGMIWIPTLELWRGVSEEHGLNWDEIAINNLETFYQAGGKIALGTDFAGYFTEFDTGFPITEVTMMKEAGMSNMDIILSGTHNAAEACDMADELGTIEAGKLADLLVVEGDPLKELETLQNTWMVIHNGQEVDLD